MDERETLLKVATPEEWDCWLTVLADLASLEVYCMSQKNCGSCKFNNAYGCLKPVPPDCLFCKAFYDDCDECMGKGNFRNPLSFHTCGDIPINERIDRAIVRLEAAGIWGKPGG